MKIKACIFDMDGTILNTLSTITYYVNKTFQKHGISPINETECKTFVGDGARKLIERALASRGCFDPDFCTEVLSEYNPEYDASPYYLTERYAGVPEMLDELKRRGIKVAVISNKPHSTTIRAAEYFYAQVFDEVCGAKDKIPLKPDPIAGKQLLNSLKVSPCEVIYVGDSGVDMLFGKALGAAYTLGALWGFRDSAELSSSGADAVFESADEMMRFILEKI